MPLTTNLIAYWELGEASGTRNDSHGTNHLADNNTVTSTTGKVGNAASFASASNEYLSLADNVALSVQGDIDFTICTWARATTLSGHAGIVVKAQSALEYKLYYDVGFNRFVFLFGDPSFNNAQVLADTIGAPATATWYFICAWHDITADTINIQVNDGAVDSTAHSAGGRDDTMDFNLGADAFNSQYWNGLIDQTGIWKRVLTTQERTDLYNSGNGLSYAGLTPTATITPTVAAASMAGVAGRMNLGLITPTTTKI